MALLMRDQEMMQKGRNQTLFSLLQDGILEPSVAAEKANMSLGEFEAAMQKAGYNIHMPL